MTEVDINRSVEDVFQFATVAQNWVKWHPNTLRVEGAIDHTAQVGEKMTEYLRVGPIPVGHVEWEVMEYVKPTRWVIAGEFPGGLGKYNITYTLTPTSDTSTHFRRVLRIETDNKLVKMLLKSLGGAYLTFTSDIAARNFKKAVEKS